MALELFKTPLAGDANIKALWKFDETSGTSAVDAISAHNGTASRSNILNNAGGVFNNCAVFDAASSDKVTVTNHADFNVSGSFSINAWLKYSNSPAFASVVTKGNSNDFSYGLQIGTTKINAILWQQNGATHLAIENATVVNNGAWHMATLTYDGTTLRIYVDAGTAATTTAKTGSWFNGTADLCLGSRTGGSGLFTGSLDDVSFFNRALTAAEITSLYQGDGWAASTGTLTNYRPRKRTPGAVSV